MKKIFMICYGGGHAEIIKETYKELVKEKNFCIKILALTTAKYKFEAENISYKTIVDYYDKQRDEPIFLLGKNFCIDKNIDTLIGKEETYLYYGYALFELEKKYGKEITNKGFERLGRKIFLPLCFMKKILEHEKPDLVITTNSPRYERAALIAAKNLNIKTLSIEDLFGVEDKSMSTEIARFFNDNLYEEIYGDYVCVMSQKAIKNLVKNKVSKVFVTGNPSFDKTLKFFYKNDNQNKNINEKKVICFLTQNRPEKFLLLEKLIEVIQKKDYFLILKIHPNEKKEEYLNKIKNNSDKIKIEESELYETILKADIIVTMTSTSSLEAMILDRDVIGKKNKFIPFKNMQLGLEYNNIEELEELIEQGLWNKNLRKVLKNGRDKFRPQKYAAEKISEIVQEILRFS